VAEGNVEGAWPLARAPAPRLWGFCGLAVLRNDNNPQEEDQLITNHQPIPVHFVTEYCSWYGVFDVFRVFTGKPPLKQTTWRGRRLLIPRISISASDSPDRPAWRDGAHTPRPPPTKRNQTKKRNVPPRRAIEPAKRGQYVIFQFCYCIPVERQDDFFLLGFFLFFFIFFFFPPPQNVVMKMLRSVVLFVWLSVHFFFVHISPGPADCSVESSRATPRFTVGRMCLILPLSCCATVGIRRS